MKKRLILRLTVALLAFGFGVAIDRVFVSRGQTPRTVWKLDPVAVQPVAACPTAPLVPLTTPTPEPHVVLHYNPATFDPRGTYFPLNPLPKEFAEFDLMELSVDDYEAKPYGSGIVQTRRNNEYDFQNANFLLITEKRIFFVAAARFDTDFEYRFDGEFLGNPGRLVDTGKAAVRGTLTKMKDGRKVAERVVSFDVKYLGC